MRLICCGNFISEWLFEVARGGNNNDYEGLVHEERPGGFNWGGADDNRPPAAAQAAAAAAPPPAGDEEH